jgi:ComF family protein
MFIINKLKSILVIFKNSFIEALFPSTQYEKTLNSLSLGSLSKILRPAPATPITNSYALFAYKDRLAKYLIWNIKYKRNISFSRLAAYEIYRSIKENGILKNIFSLNKDSKIIFIPIPINVKRRKERGYNQTELLTRELKSFDIENHFTVITDLLTRPDHNEHQTRKDRRGRIQGALNIFQINTMRHEELKRQDGGILNTKIIILDDVITTGSTILSAMNTLNQAGWKHVYALSIAH